MKERSAPAAASSRSPSDLAQHERGLLSVTQEFGSARVYRGLEGGDGPVGRRDVHRGRTAACFHGRTINLTHVFAGQNVGVTQVGERIWLVTLMHDDLGSFDDQVGRAEPIENPFGSKVLGELPMCSE